MPPVDPNACTANADLTLVLDKSGSMDGSMEDMRDMARNIVSQFDLSSTTGRVAVVSFNGGATTQISLSTSRSSINDAICQIPAADGGTVMETGLSNAQSIFSSQPRDGARQIVFLMSDGVNSNGMDSTAISKAPHPMPSCRAHHVTHADPGSRSLLSAKLCQHVTRMHSLRIPSACLPRTSRVLPTQIPRHLRRRIS
jgi:Mg-chelatase subunit ChlD